MKKATNIIKKHKIITSVLCICLICFIGVGTAFGLHQAKIANTQKALLMAKDGYIDSDELNQLGEDIVEGEEIVMDDGTVVVVSKDENGNYVTKSYEHGDTPTPTPTPAPQPTHVHTWIAHYTTVHRVESHKESHDICTKCHTIVDTVSICPVCKIPPSTSRVKIDVVDREWDEQVVDYYYCSECGARQ